MKLKELKIGKVYLVNKDTMTYCGPVKHHRCDDGYRDGYLFEFSREPGTGFVVEGKALRGVKECPRSRKRNLNKF